VLEATVLINNNRVDEPSMMRSGWNIFSKKRTSRIEFHEL